MHVFPKFTKLFRHGSSTLRAKSLATPLIFILSICNLIILGMGGVVVDHVVEALQDVFSSDHP
jgi:hypothetical protein